MDFDSIIPLLFVIAFFVLPSLLKQILARKKASVPSSAPRKKPSLFGKIGEQIQQFTQELEKQAREQRNAGKEQGTVWETLSEDEELDSGFVRSDKDADFSEFLMPASREKTKIVKEPPPAKKIPSRKKVPLREPVTRPLSKNYRLKSNPLQNAVIWSEILSKPLALKDK